MTAARTSAAEALLKRYAGHTEGPWALTPHPEYPSLIRHLSGPCKALTIFRKFDVPEDTSGLSEADAQLLTDSPTLLTALAAALELLARANFGRHIQPEGDCAACAMEAARDELLAQFTKEDKP